MSETRTVHDPFLNKTVEVSNNLVDRLRGKYATGPIMPNGEPEFGWRIFETPPIQHEAAQRIERLAAEIESLRKSGRKAVDAGEVIIGTLRGELESAERALAEAVEIMRLFAEGSIDVAEAAIIIGYPAAKPALIAARDFITAQEKEKGK